MRGYYTNLYRWIFINWIFCFETRSFKPIEFSYKLSHQCEQRFIEFNLFSFLHVWEIQDIRFSNSIIAILEIFCIKTLKIIDIIIVIRDCIILLGLKRSEYFLNRFLIRMCRLIILMDTFDFFSSVIVNNRRMRNVFHFTLECMSLSST